MDRARAACDLIAFAGFDAALAVHVPDDHSQGVVIGGAGRIEPLVDIARGVARRVVRDGRAMQLLDTDPRLAGSERWRHLAIPVGRTSNGTAVLVVSDRHLTRREGQSMATWAAPSHATDALTRAKGGACASLMRELARDFDADAVVLALFAVSGMLVHVHVRSGALLHEARVPTDTVWGEVARHGAAFTLGDLTMHPGAELLGSVGMRTAGLVGLENGNGLPIGAIGVASEGDLDLDIAHQLLARAPGLGPTVMSLLSRTDVPVPDEAGTVDLRVLAARVGCRRFAMYERSGSDLRLVAAHAQDGSKLVSPPDASEEQLVCWAAQKGIGVVNEDAAAVLIGDSTVLYAQDPSKRALECLRLALHDVRNNPFGTEARGDESARDAA
ncbi:MAG: hypothetical protein JWM86_2542 [Thermoleophilia bacterium]|nr:hypothetical protein [Thermoleophilia bacterium]